jgi:hypothetical protein
VRPNPEILLLSRLRNSLAKLAPWTVNETDAVRLRRLLTNVTAAIVDQEAYLRRASTSWTELDSPSDQHACPKADDFDARRTQLERLIAEYGANLVALRTHATALHTAIAQHNMPAPDAIAAIRQQLERAGQQQVLQDEITARIEAGLSQRASRRRRVREPGGGQGAPEA